MILVPLFDLKFLDEFAASGAGTSNRRHYADSIVDHATFYPRTLRDRPQVAGYRRSPGGDHEYSLRHGDEGRTGSHYRLRIEHARRRYVRSRPGRHGSLLQDRDRDTRTTVCR